MCLLLWFGMWDEIQSTISRRLFLGSGIGKTDPWIGHVSTRYQQLILLGESFPMMIRLVCFDPFRILMSDWLFDVCSFFVAILPAAPHGRMRVEQPTRQRKKKAAMHAFWTCITNECSAAESTPEVINVDSSSARRQRTLQISLLSDRLLLVD